ncbi:hypothetical protein AYI68_g2940 [Smittium mucronatum]|uniref:Uncharacterized protein n=1 Tax=Smittium mucronatum TaxID=133383 RepID=A0A1R0H1C0_9FUNG|nr:hypothetical protein AYI68_g2940 [Smittium mucronatum]
MTPDTTEEPSNIWNNHYGDLANDSTRNIRSTNWWESLVSSDFYYFPECDAIIRWSDITSALSETPNNNAPDDDGVCSEVWKLVASEKIPESKMTKIIHKIINLMYDSGEIPNNMDTRIVVPVPKKVDIKDPNKYRVISLILTLSKLLYKKIATKLAHIDKKYENLVK